MSLYIVSFSRIKYMPMSFRSEQSDVVDAQATAFVCGGMVTRIQITHPGRGYYRAPQIRFRRGGGSGALARVQISGGYILEITIINGGRNYNQAPEIEFKI